MDRNRARCVSHSEATKTCLTAYVPIMHLCPARANDGLSTSGVFSVHQTSHSLSSLSPSSSLPPLSFSLSLYLSLFLSLSLEGLVFSISCGAMAGKALLGTGVGRRGPCQSHASLMPSGAKSSPTQTPASAWPLAPPPPIQQNLEPSSPPCRPAVPPWLPSTLRS